MRRTLQLCLTLSLAATAPVLAQGTITDAPVGFVRGATPWDTTPTANLVGVSATLTDDHLFETGWWFRVATDTQETAFPVPDTQSYVANVSDIGWNDVAGRGIFSAREVTQVFNTGPNYGFPSGYVQIQLQITNLNPVDPLEIEIFHFADLDLAGSSMDSAAWTELTPLSILALTDPSGNKAQYVTFPNATAFMVRPFGATTDVAGLLSDASVTNFDNSGVPFGPGDFTGGWQFSLSIPPAGNSVVMALLMVNASGYCYSLQGIFCDGFRSEDLYFWSFTQL